jgi:hypothetical protein
VPPFIRNPGHNPRKLDEQPTAGRVVGDPSKSLDLDDSVEGSCDPNERDSDTLAPEEVDVFSKGSVTKKMPMLVKEGYNAAVYDQLHRLPSDTDWWRSYLG